MATMDRPSRIVRCPKCLALLQEPPPGTPLYKCGNCSTVLRAKHASVDGSRRPITRGQQQNRPTPPGHAEGPDNRRVPSKPVPPDHMSRPPALGDPGDQSNRTGNNRPTPVDIGKRLPSQAHHGSFPPGPTPLQVPHGSNTNDGNGLRPGRDHHRLSPRDSLAAQGSGDADSRRGREGPTFMPQTKTSSPARVEEVQPGGKPPNFVLHKLPAPPVNQIRNPAVKYDITGEKEGVADWRTRNTPINADISTRQKSPPVTPAADAPLVRRASADVPIQGSVSRERERQRKPEDEKDDPPYSPSKALAALHQQNTGPLYKVKERQVPALGPTRSSQGLPVVRGRNKSQGDETMGTKNPDFAFQRNVDGVEAGPSTGRSREEMLGVHRRQRSDGVAISDRSAGNDRNPALPVVVRRSVEDDAKDLRKLPEELISRHPALENEKRILTSVEATADKMKSRDDPPSTRADEVTVMQDQKPIARASSSDGAGRLKETNSVSPPKANALEQDLSPTSDSALVRRKQQKEDSDLKARFKEKLGVNRDSFDDEEPKPIILLDDLDHVEFSAQSPRTTRKSLSPPRNLLSPPSFISSKSAFGAGVQRQPEQPSKVKADSRADPDAPSSLQTFPGLPDVLDYDTSDDSSNDADSSYQIVSKPHSEELKYSRNGQGVQPDAIHGNDEGSDDEGEQERTHRKSPNPRSKDQQEIIGSYGPVKSSAGGSPYFRSPESIHDRASPSQAQASDQRMEEQQGNFTRKSDTHESTSFSFGQGGDSRGSAYAMLKGQTQTVRLQINTPVPERIHVRCRHCSLQLQVPLNLPRSETGVQKLRCGSCWKISRFRLNHLLSPSRSPSPGGSCENSPESSFRLGESNSSAEGTSSRYSGTRSNRETGAQDRVVLRTQSGANLPVPPSARHNPRAASGSKLAIMVSGSSLQSETSKVSTPNTSGDLGPVGSSSQAGGNQNVDMLTSPSAGPAESQAHVFLSPALSSTSQDTSMKDRQQQKTSPDLKILHSSSDSDEEKATAQLKIGPTGAFNPARNPSWSAPETPDFDDGHEFKGLKGFLKKSVKELTKGKKSTQYRRKVVVNGHAVPDDVVKKAEEFAGAIHPGTYWYDFRAGFWGVMGGPCLGMIPPFIDELNFPLARHCSHGKTGVLVNGRELHHKDLELLKKRGLPGTPGKAYNVDIDGRLTEESTGVELKGLGRLAPTLEQTGRGPGMWVPESQRGS